jgi:hypothetical protein
MNQFDRTRLFIYVTATKLGIWRRPKGSPLFSVEPLDSLGA